MAMTTRECGGCTLCCKVIAVPALAKPAGTYCPHCVPDTGCAIYAHRPNACAKVFCGWLQYANLGPEWRPDRCHVVLWILDDGQICAVVDQEHPEAWRRPDIRAALRTWARTAHVKIVVGEETFIVLPGGEYNVGQLDEHEVIVARPAHGGHYLVFEKYKRASQD